MSKDNELNSITEVIEHLVEELEPQLEEALQSANKQVKEKPLAAVGIAALVFLIVGYFLGRGSRK